MMLEILIIILACVFVVFALKKLADFLDELMKGLLKIISVGLVVVIILTFGKVVFG